MATANPFDILGDDDNDDLSHLIAVQQQKIATKKPAPAAAPVSAAAKLPSKPAPPTQAGDFPSWTFSYLDSDNLFYFLIGDPNFSVVLSFLYSHLVSLS